MISDDYISLRADGRHVYVNADFPARSMDADELVSYASAFELSPQQEAACHHVVLILRRLDLALKS